MNIGVPKEIKDNEKRISLTPSGAKELTTLGHNVFIETMAGIGSGFTDNSYLSAGATILQSANDIFSKCEFIIKVKEPQTNEISMLNERHTMFTFFHFAADETLTNNFIKSKATAIAYETVQNNDGSLPILIPMSEVAGRMSVQNGAKCLEENMGGKGKLLGGVPGVKPANITILGAGIVGTNAAKLAAGLGGNVHILDVNMDRLRYLDDVMPKNVNTLYSNKHNINAILKKTDLLIGAVLIVGRKAPKLISKDMLKNMSPGSVIVDVAVDQGGCVETCKPTTHKKPTYNVDSIVHYCVSNMPGSVPYTSTLALTNITLPYIVNIAENGIKEAFRIDKTLLKGLNIYNGCITHEGVSNSFGYEYHNPDKFFS